MQVAVWSLAPKALARTLLLLPVVNRWDCKPRKGESYRGNATARFRILEFYFGPAISAEDRRNVKNKSWDVRAL